MYDYVENFVSQACLTSVDYPCFACQFQSSIIFQKGKQTDMDPVIHPLLIGVKYKLPKKKEIVVHLFNTKVFLNIYMI